MSSHSMPADNASRHEGSPWAPEAITRAIEPVISDAGLIVEDVTVKGGNTPTLQILVDLPSGTDAVDLDVLAEVSQQVGEVLDNGLLASSGAYELEVSSPGASRPLTQPRHFQRNVGRVIRVVGEDEDFTGTVLEADDEGIVIEPIKPAPKKGMKDKVLDPVRREYADIRRAKVDIEATAAARLAAVKDAEDVAEESMEDPAQSGLTGEEA